MDAEIRDATSHWIERVYAKATYARRRQEQAQQDWFTIIEAEEIYASRIFLDGQFDLT